MKNGKRRTLHQPIPELKEAAEAKLPKPWEPCWAQREREERLAAKRERDRNRKMPAHQSARGKRRLLYIGQGVPVYEDEADYRRRVWNRAHRRAHKTTEPPKG